MVALALLAVGVISARLLRLEAMPDITFPGMQVIVPYPGSTPEEIEQLDRAPGRGGARDAVRHRGNPRQRAVGPGAVRHPVRLGPRRRRRRVRGAHQARLDPAAAAGGRRPAADVGVQRRRDQAARRDPHLRPTRDLTDQYEMLEKYLQRPIERHRGRRARRTAGRPAARGAHARRPDPARGLRRRRAAAARAARVRAISRSAPARSPRTARASPCARSASSTRSTTSAT